MQIFQWQANDRSWCDYSKDISEVLSKGDPVDFEMNGVSYHADPVRMRQTHKLNSTQFRRIRGLDSHTSWECSQCSYNNNDELDLKCNICGANKPKRSKQDKGNATLQASTLQPLSRQELQDPTAQLVYIYNITTASQQGNPNKLPDPDHLVDYAYCICAMMAANIDGNMNNSTPSQPPRDTCIVCMIRFSEQNPSVDLGNQCGGHGHICADCLKQHMAAEVSEKNVMPGIKDPRVGHTHKMLPGQMLALLDTASLTSFLSLVSNALLSRKDKWNTCSKCQQGSLDAKKCVHCNIPYVRQHIGPELQRLIDANEAMLCPKCSEFLLHQRGMCTLMKCSKCFEVSNIETGESGPSLSVMKQNARDSDTLWYPADLDYQRQLEARDPAAFKALLESNGVKHDATYTRGTS